MKRLITILSLLLLTLTTQAKNDYSSLWQRGNTAYNQKNYDSAVYYYGQIAARKPAEYIVYYNLGNSYYKLNNIGLAVLNYRRALHFNPSHKQTLDNLLLAQSRIPDRIPEVKDIFFLRWWKGITAASMANTWAIISLTIFLLLMAYSIFRRLGIIKLYFPIQANIAAWVFCTLFITFAFIASAHKRNPHIAVVVQNNSMFMEKPSAGKSQNIPEGTTVNLAGSEAKGKWIEVVLPDGKKGWMQKEDFIEI